MQVKGARVGLFLIILHHLIEPGPFNAAMHGQRVTGMILDKDKKPMTMFTVIYSKPKK